jgi:hypothetical protein
MDLEKSEKITDLTLRLIKKLAGENQPESNVNRMKLIFPAFLLQSITSNHSNHQ